MKDLFEKFKLKVENINYTDYEESGMLANNISNSNLTEEEKIELLELMTDKKLNANSESIMTLSQLYEQMKIEGEFDYEN